jgi:hypothetical protein
MDDLIDVSETGQYIVKHFREEKSKDDRLTVNSSESRRMLNGMGATPHNKLAEDGRIKSLLIGGRRVFLTASIYDYLIEEAIRSHPAGQPPLKLDKPLARHWRERREKAAADAQSARKAHSGRAQPSLGKPASRLPPLA